MYMHNTLIASGDLAMANRAASLTFVIRAFRMFRIVRKFINHSNNLRLVTGHRTVIIPGHDVGTR